MAITGKPLAAACTMCDTLGWGGETQALVYDPRSGEALLEFDVTPDGGKTRLNQTARFLPKLA